MLDNAHANTFPHIQVQNNTALPGRTRSPQSKKIDEDQLFSQRAFAEDAISMMISGFCKDVFNSTADEFAVADRLLSLKLEGSVG